jgi:hypothetical protein
MKTKMKMKSAPLPIGLVAGLTVIGCLGTARADIIVDQFDDASTLGSYSDAGWGVTRATFTWDSTQNAVSSTLPNDPGSGALKWQIDWSASTTTDQDVSGRNLGGSLNVPALGVSRVEFDLMVDPSSPQDLPGSYGYLQNVWIPATGWWSFNGIQLHLTQAGTWYHVVAPVNGNPTWTDIRSFGFKMQQDKELQISGTGVPLVGTTTFWIDNIAFVPEPSSIALGMMGMAGLFYVRRIRK